jgi:hypothetical protein
MTSRRALLLSLGLGIWVLMAGSGVQAADPSEAPDAVVELDQVEYEVLDSQRAVLRQRRVLRILNEAGSRRHATWGTWEDEFRSCSRFKAQIRDATGHVVRTFGKGDLRRDSQTNDPLGHVEGVALWGEFRWGSYPHTLELEAEIAHGSLFFCPDWEPQGDLPVTESSFTLRNPESLVFRQQELGFVSDSTRQISADGRRWCWTLHDLKARHLEVGMPGEERLALGLLLAPQRFELGGVAGSLESWDTLADWFRELARDRATLSPAAQLEAQQQVSGLVTDRERVAALYAYLQRNTRYVSIQQGLGGWQPHPAQRVHELKYGDCKDLTQYMIALLAAVQLPARPALVRTRPLGALRVEFPDNVFNHMICCVPVGSDTLWLECTSDLLAAGELPPMDEGLQVLLVGEMGGSLVTTPQSGAADNRLMSHIQARLDAQGQVGLEGRLTGRGQVAQVLRSRLQELRGEERATWMRQWLEPCFPGLDLRDGPRVTGEAEAGQPLQLSFNAASRLWLQRTGSRWLLAPFRLQAVRRAELPAAGPRQSAVELEMAVWQTDSIVVELPPGFRLEAAPESKELRWSLGSYRAEYRTEPGRLWAIREFRLEQRRIPATAYDEYRAFLQAVCRQDESAFLLTRPESSAP